MNNSTKLTLNTNRKEELKPVMFIRTDILLKSVNNGSWNVYSPELFVRIGQSQIIRHELIYT